MSKHYVLSEDLSSVSNGTPINIPKGTIICLEEIYDTSTTKEGLWSDEDMVEFANQYHWSSTRITLDKFKASKQSQSNTPKEELLDLANPNPKYSFSPSYQPKEEQPTKERISVQEFYYEGKYAHGREYVLAVKEMIPEEKFPLIKRCIEYVLNGEAKEYWRLVDELLPGQLKYTQEQLDKAIEGAFNAARERKYIKDPSIRTISDFAHDFRYKTLSDYLSSIKNKKQ